MVRKLIILLSISALSFMTVSCGKKGDLLPPPDYEESKAG